VCVAQDLGALLPLAGDEVSWVRGWRRRQVELLVSLSVCQVLSQRTRIRWMILLAVGMRYRKRRMMVMYMPTQPQRSLRKLYERHSRCRGRRRRNLIRIPSTSPYVSTNDMRSIRHNLRQVMNLLL
jgi:hypothetical protein